jgi:prephenate dehydrogenase
VEEAALLAEIVEQIGGYPIYMTAAEHDRTVAFTSHLPQLLSTTLAKTLSDVDGEYINQVFGTGLLDMTRLALSSSELWLSILHTNRTEVAYAIDRFVRELATVREALDREELTSIFGTATKFAKTIRKNDGTQ